MRPLAHGVQQRIAPVALTAAGAGVLHRAAHQGQLSLDLGELVLPSVVLHPQRTGVSGLQQDAEGRVDALLAEYPDDPYFHELKGQMLFENGHVAEAIAPYRKAVRLRPDASLLKVGLAQALIESGAPGANAEAIAHLEEAVARARGLTAELARAAGNPGDGEEDQATVLVAEDDPAAELFDALPPERRREIFPPERAAEAIGITGFTLPTLYRFVTSERGRAASLYPFKRGHYLGSGSAAAVLKEAHMDGEQQFRAIKEYIRSRR